MHSAVAAATLHTPWQTNGIAAIAVLQDTDHSPRLALMQTGCKQAANICMHWQHPRICSI